MDPEREPESPISRCPDNNTVFPFLTDSIADIDRDITYFQNSLSLYPRSHLFYIKGVHNLFWARWERYRLSREKEDLDKSIVHCTEAIFLPPVSRDLLNLSNVFQLLFNLASVLLKRSEEFEQNEDVKYSIDYLRYLRGLPLDPFDLPRNIVTGSLIEALATQVRLDAGDMTSNIKEMMVLCRELLASNMSADIPISPILSFDKSVQVAFNRGLPVELLGEVIECLRDAVKVCPPASYDLFLALAGRIITRFIKTHSKGDYEEATALLERILDPHASVPGGCPDSIRAITLSLVTMFARLRSTIFKNPEYSEVTISRLRTEHSNSPVDKDIHRCITSSLEFEARRRFTQYSLAENLDEANSYISEAVDLSSSGSLEVHGVLIRESEAVRESYSMTRMAEKIQRLEKLLSTTPIGTERHQRCLHILALWYQTKFHCTNDISDIEESIKYGRLSCDAAHPSDTWRHNYHISLCDILYLAFEKTGKISYLDESITVGYDNLGLGSAQHLHFDVIQKLVQSLLTRDNLHGRILVEDRHEAIRLISTVIDDKYTREPDRFRLSCQWAILARSVRHPITLTAYKTALTLMQKSLSFTPTVPIQHARLVEMGENCQTMPLDYASYQIHLGQFEEAVETLEQGRSLLWSEMRGFRTPMTQLIEEQSPLGERFAEINRELEALTISVAPSGRPEVEDGVDQVGDGMDPFGRLVVKRKNLLEERVALISQIQGRPELQGILSPPSFTTLRSAASRGPVIIINHCEWRSDILIIFHNSLPCSIPTDGDFYARANKLRDELAEARKQGLDSDEYQDVLCSVLKGLYELVGEPVIKRLRVLGVPEQSRIWWCPTSVFCSLPLHAMGPIPSREPSKQYFCDLYIPSYTPSISALVESRRASPRKLDKPSLLLVARPDDSLPGVKGEIKVIRALQSRISITVTSLVSSDATPTSVVDGLLGSRFAHIACHGELEAGKPFEASFKLHGGERLTLLEIVRSQLPDAEFAFLSCCHSAGITEASVADEGLHLTTAMQYCGFRSVVGTMWEMADTDGRDLSKNFYKSLFSREDAGVPHYERSAHALQYATRKLRSKRVSLERWVNFVHYGA